jgi:hypothetical protein
VLGGFAAGVGRVFAVVPTLRRDRIGAPGLATG